LRTLAIKTLASYFMIKKQVTDSFVRVDASRKTRKSKCLHQISTGMCLLFLATAVSSCAKSDSYRMKMDQGSAEKKLAGEKRTRSQAWPSDSIALVPQPQPEDTELASTALAVHEIFREVRRFLTREDKANLSCTNKAIRAAARDTTRSLDFSVNNTQRNRGITSAQLAEFIPKYAHAHIDHVNLSGCTLITDTGLQALAQHCTGLTKLYLAGCRLITDTGLQALAQHCTGLKELYLAGCRLITDTGLQALAQHCTGLKELNLAGCRLITDVGLQALAQHCTGLTELYLAECSLITNAGLQALAQHCTGLTELDVEECDQITDAGLQALAQRCTGLTKLDLDGCDLITNAGLRALAQHCTGLTGLDLYGCSLITDAGLRALAQHCTGLTSLTLCRFTQITDAGLRALRQDYPHIRIFEQS
jgi:Leucine Rich repeat